MDMNYLEVVLFQFFSQGGGTTTICPLWPPTWEYLSENLTK